MAAIKKTKQRSVCPLFHQTIEVIGRRWSGAILRVLQEGPARFGELRAAVPDLSDRLLSERLKELEEFGLVAQQQIDAHSVYRLTPKGEALKPALDALGDWASKWVGHD